MKSLFYTFTVLAFLSICSTTQAQVDYKTAVGGRLGYPLAASFKQFINDSHAFEVYVGARWYSGYSWTSVSGAYLVHKPIDSVDGLNYYFGGGASVYFWSFGNGIEFNGFNTTSVGIQAYGGLDYKFEDLPLNISVDWIPTVFINSFITGFGGGFGSVAARYTLN